MKLNKFNSPGSSDLLQDPRLFSELNCQWPRPDMQRGGDPGPAGDGVVHDLNATTLVKEIGMKSSRDLEKLLRNIRQPSR